MMPSLDPASRGRERAADHRQPRRRARPRNAPRPRRRARRPRDPRRRDGARGTRPRRRSARHDRRPRCRRARSGRRSRPRDADPRDRGGHDRTRSRRVHGCDAASCAPAPRAVPDGLSTFAAMVALDDLDVPAARQRLERGGRCASQCQEPDAEVRRPQHRRRVVAASRIARSPSSPSPVVPETKPAPRSAQASAAQASPRRC